MIDLRELPVGRGPPTTHCGRHIAAMLRPITTMSPIPIKTLTAANPNRQMPKNLATSQTALAGFSSVGGALSCVFMPAIMPLLSSANHPRASVRFRPLAVVKELAAASLCLRARPEPGQGERGGARRRQSSQPYLIDRSSARQRGAEVALSGAPENHRPGPPETARAFPQAARVLRKPRRWLSSA